MNRINQGIIILNFYKIILLILISFCSDGESNFFETLLFFSIRRKRKTIEIPY